jgi:hypothetical protein
MSSNVRELTDGELDSVGGGHHHHHHHGSWSGGGSNVVVNLFINIGNVVGAEIGALSAGSIALSGIGSLLVGST